MSWAVTVDGVTRRYSIALTARQARKFAFEGMPLFVVWPAAGRTDFAFECR